MSDERATQLDAAGAASLPGPAVELPPLPPPSGGRPATPECDRLVAVELERRRLLKWLGERGQ